MKAFCGMGFFFLLLMTAAAPARAQRVAHWSLDAVLSGQVLDDTGNGYHGSVVGSPALVTHAQKYGGVNFIQSTDGLNLGSATQLCPPALTLTMWIKFDSLSADVIPLQRFTWMQDGYYIKYDQAGNDLYAEIFDGDTSTRKTVSFAGTNTSNALSTGQFYHLALSCDGTTLRSYFNGALVETASAGSVVANALSLMAGYGAAGVTLDEITLYAEALSAPAIADLYAQEASPYDFEGSISRGVLEGYLSRAVTHLGLLASYPEQAPNDARLAEDMRMLGNVGAKFIGRAAYSWGVPGNEDAFFSQIQTRSALLHTQDTGMILQACIFEIVTQDMNNIAIPSWVFQAFGQTVATRNFNYSAMLYSDNTYVDQWGSGLSVPDMSRLETRLWFYYRARRFIDAGCEAIHFGQVALMDGNDPGHAAWFDLLGRVRSYASQAARRRFVLCDAHTFGIAQSGQLLFDFHSYPCRPQEVAGQPYEAWFATGTNYIYNQSLDGTTPSGWSTAGTGLPYLVEIDNFGVSANPGQSGQGSCWVWGWDEISWFAHLSSEARNRWLRYAQLWLSLTDSSGYLQPALRRSLADPVNGNSMFCGNTLSSTATDGMSIEKMVRCLFSGEDYNPLGAQTALHRFTSAGSVEFSRQADDTLQQAMAQGQVTITLGDTQWGAAPQLADYQSESQPGTTMAFPQDTVDNPYANGYLDLQFNTQYTGSRLLREITLWIYPATDTRRFYDLELYASSTSTPTQFEMIYATRCQQADTVTAGQGTALRLRFPQDWNDSLSTLRIAVRVASSPLDDVNYPWYLATALDEIDVNLGDYSQEHSAAQLGWYLVE